MRRIRDGRLLNMNGELDIKPTIGKEREKKGKWGGGGWECDKERKKRERKRPYQMNIIGAFVLKIVTVLPSSWSNLFPIISCSFSNYRKAWDKLQIPANNAFNIPTNTTGADDLSTLCIQWTASSISTTHIIC